ncbi:ATP-binding cassette domain-containing protein [Nonomuraea salmonea]|uniref:ATP-binding cassette domain-containing protein n=1 Tax=Nonomuraea salmonea TaxID=46181 RepID=UPI002FEA44B8
MSSPAEPLLSVKDLHTSFPVRSSLLRRKIGAVHAVSGVSFDLPKGRTLGLVGESGSGKTTLARTVIGLAPPESGQVLFDGQDLLTLSGDELRQVRRQIQMIFQDPYASLNPPPHRRADHQRGLAGQPRRAAPRQVGVRGARAAGQSRAEPGPRRPLPPTSSPAGSASGSASRGRSRCGPGW